MAGTVLIKKGVAILNIKGVFWIDEIVEKLDRKHDVQTYEVEEVFLNKPIFRFMEKGERKEEDIYLALGQTYSGRYLAIIFIYKKTKEALILSARNMTRKERKYHERKRK